MEASGGRAALVLFSGGQDSTTCLAWALERHERVETIAFDYRQRHRVELDARAPIRDALRAVRPIWSERLGDDHLVALDALADVSRTALTSEVEIAAQADGLPNTFVPGRNLLFLTFAAAVAHRRGIRHIVTGVCETDFFGYPDCRDDTVKAMQVALNLGMQAHFVVHTPLMWLDKAQTWALAEAIGGTALVEIVRRESRTCYMGETSREFAWGVGCGDCPACLIRAKGYEAFRGTRAAEAATAWRS